MYVIHIAHIISSISTRIILYIYNLYTTSTGGKNVPGKMEKITVDVLTILLPALLLKLLLYKM